MKKGCAKTQNRPDLISVRSARFLWGASSCNLFSWVATSGPESSDRVKRSPPLEVQISSRHGSYRALFAQIWTIGPTPLPLPLRDSSLDMIDDALIFRHGSLTLHIIFSQPASHTPKRVERDEDYRHAEREERRNKCSDPYLPFESHLLPTITAPRHFHLAPLLPDALNPEQFTMPVTDDDLISLPGAPLKENSVPVPSFNTPIRSPFAIENPTVSVPHDLVQRMG
jgi:hypothetical protein